MARHSSLNTQAAFHVPSSESRQARQPRQPHQNNSFSLMASNSSAGVPFILAFRRRHDPDHGGDHGLPASGPEGHEGLHHHVRQSRPGGEPRARAHPVDGGRPQLQQGVRRQRAAVHWQAQEREGAESPRATCSERPLQSKLKPLHVGVSSLKPPNMTKLPHQWPTDLKDAAHHCTSCPAVRAHHATTS